MKLEEGSREYVFYVHDTKENENVFKRPDLIDCQNEVRKRNKKEPGRYKARGSWVLHKVRN